MSIAIKTIGALKNYKFYVPAYQRGYRWTEDEATALLNDVMEFEAINDCKYCIQPLIVKACGDGTYEVVDGQQRLTTIYIIMKIAEQEIRSARPPFEITYKTREKSADFLKKLQGDVPVNKENIDFYHISIVYRAINSWLQNQPDVSVAIQKLNTKFRESVFFIWYELPSDNDPITMFTKVNLGKIPLTDAELIKALLLNQANFNEEIYKRQTEISIAWDRIEQGLRDDSFWYFLNEKERSGTRIDMLFGLLAKQKNKDLLNPINENQSHFAFLVFSEVLSKALDKEECVKRLWGEIEKIYEEFREWYNDLNKYHIIGFIIASGESIESIFKITRGKRKSQVLSDLLSLAKSKIGKIDIDSLTRLEYGSQNAKIRKVLLLFNIATLVCKSEKQYRFPFDLYKGESPHGQKWDIEHIHATADETDEPDGSLCNLTLLDSATNRSQLYACKPFNEKRAFILDKESNGLFVPVCTKNVFLKVYTKRITDLTNWNDNDKKDYISAINSTFEQFFSGGFKHD